MPTAQGTFEIELAPPQAELAGRISRIEFTKDFAGDLVGTGQGLMLSGGDPASGAAGYVAIETVDGQLHDLAGGFALQQFGTMFQGASSLRYLIVPGSGQGALTQISGELELTVEADGTHRYEISYQV